MGLENPQQLRHRRFVFGLVAEMTLSAVETNKSLILPRLAGCDSLTRHFKIEYGAVNRVGVKVK
jgi:hypothetical protein